MASKNGSVHAKQLKYYEGLRAELELVLDSIKKDKDDLLFLKKPVVNPDTKYGNRILSCITLYCNEKRPLTNILDEGYYADEENVSWEYNQILKLNFLINCTYGIDYILSKKAVCMMLGISIDDYQKLLESDYDSKMVFKNIEQWLIASRQESAENFNRNAIAIDSTLKTKGKYGGYEVEVKTPKTEFNGSPYFDPLKSSYQEIENHLQKFLGVSEKNSKEK